jgi:3-hydroxyisobutyrate dehydrogenase
VTNAAAMQAVYTGPGGLLSVDVTGKVFIDMSTVLGRDHQALAPDVERKGALFLECPVSGAVAPARSGMLVGFAGGTVEAFDATRPVLAQLCRRAERIGTLGAGAATKLAANLLLTVFWQAFAEACALVHEVPVKPGLLVDLLADTNIGAALLKARAADIVRALEGQPGAAASFDIDFMRKDLGEILEQARAVGVTLPLAAQTQRCFDAASRAGAGYIDGTAYPA